jgi:hypothetical protein
LSLLCFSLFIHVLEPLLRQIVYFGRNEHASASGADSDNSSGGFLILAEQTGSQGVKRGKEGGGKRGRKEG